MVEKQAGLVVLDVPIKAVLPVVGNIRLRCSFYSCIYAIPQFTPSLILRRHLHTCLRRQHIIRRPETRHRFRLRVEVDPALAVKRIRPAARDALLVPREAEHGQRHGDGHVDADLAGFYFLLEAGGGATGAGEDGDAVAVFVGVDEGDGGVDGGDGEADEYRAEDLGRVAGHVRFDVGDYCRTELCALWLVDFRLRQATVNIIRTRKINLPSCHWDISRACGPVHRAGWWHLLPPPSR